MLHIVLYSPKSLTVLMQLMNHFFFCDEMCGLVDKLHKLIGVVRPVIEDIVGILGLGEVDDAGKAVDFGGHCAIYY